MYKNMLFFVVILLMSFSVLGMQFREFGHEATIGQNNFNQVHDSTEQELLAINKNFKQERDTKHFKHRVLSHRIRKFKQNSNVSVEKTTEYEKVIRLGCLDTLVERRVIHAGDTRVIENGIIAGVGYHGPTDTRMSTHYTKQAKIFGSTLGAAAIGIIGYVAANIM